jgi:hypothetical protein
MPGRLVFERAAVVCMRNNNREAAILSCALFEGGP